MKEELIREERIREERIEEKKEKAVDGDKRRINYVIVKNVLEEQAFVAIEGITQTPFKTKNELYYRIKHIVEDTDIAIKSLRNLTEE